MRHVASTRINDESMCITAGGFTYVRVNGAHRRTYALRCFAG